jgi:hypothetical protein
MTTPAQEAQAQRTITDWGPAFYCDKEERDVTFENCHLNCLAQTFHCLECRIGRQARTFVETEPSTTPIPETPKKEKNKKCNLCRKERGVVNFSMSRHTGKELKSCDNCRKYWIKNNEKNTKVKKRLALREPIKAEQLPQKNLEPSPVEEVIEIPAICYTEDAKNLNYFPEELADVISFHQWEGVLQGIMVDAAKNFRTPAGELMFILHSYFTGSWSKR